jgi:hypothetical protein
MAAIIFFAAIMAGGLAVLLARYAPPVVFKRRRADGRKAIPPSLLRALTIELLDKLGMTLVEEASEERTLVLVKREPLGESRYVVMLDPAPANDVSDQATVLLLAESVKVEKASTGMLITPGQIETGGLAGLDVPLELIDGHRFRSLVAENLPHRLAVLERYRGFGAGGAAHEPRVTARTSLR